MLCYPNTCEKIRTIRARITEQWARRVPVRSLRYTNLSYARFLNKKFRLSLS